MDLERMRARRWADSVDAVKEHMGHFLGFEDQVNNPLRVFADGVRGMRPQPCQFSWVKKKDQFQGLGQQSKRLAEGILES